MCLNKILNKFKKYIMAKEYSYGTVSWAEDFTFDGYNSSNNKKGLLASTLTTKIQSEISDNETTFLAANNTFSGDNTFSGNNTFSGETVVQTPTTDYHASTKKYVDDTVTNIGAVATNVANVWTAKQSIDNETVLSIGNGGTYLDLNIKKNGSGQFIFETDGNEQWYFDQDMNLTASSNFSLIGDIAVPTSATATHAVNNTRLNTVIAAAGDRFFSASNIDADMQSDSGTGTWANTTNLQGANGHLSIISSEDASGSDSTYDLHCMVTGQWASVFEDYTETGELGLKINVGADYIPDNSNDVAVIVQGYIGSSAIVSGRIEEVGSDFIRVQFTILDWVAGTPAITYPDADISDLGASGSTNGFASFNISYSKIIVP